jgi:AraC-like DNA-binding protein
MRFVDVVFVYHLRDERQIAWHGRLHSHPKGQYELHYFISGEGSFRNLGAVHAIEPGTLHVTPPATPHQIFATDARRPITYYAVLVDALADFDEGSGRDRAGEAELLGLLDRLGSRGPLTVGTSQRFFFADLLEKSASGKRPLVLAAYHGLLSFLYSLDGGQAASRAPTDNAHVEKALAIMQGNIEGELNLSALCDRIQLSREHFVRLFSERMGMPPMRYYSRLKIEAARAMLSSTNLRVQEIADKLGYENQFNFARAFKRVSGMAPTEYRATCLQRPDFVGTGSAVDAGARAPSST